MWCKYVIIRDKNGCNAPILFPVTVNHDRFEELCPGSAGFYDDRQGTNGYSSTLKLGPAQYDEQLIKNFLGR